MHTAPVREGSKVKELAADLHCAHRNPKGDSGLNSLCSLSEEEDDDDDEKSTRAYGPARSGGLCYSYTKTGSAHLNSRSANPYSAANGYTAANCNLRSADTH